MASDRAFDIAFDTAQRILSVTPSRKQAFEHVREQIRHGGNREFWERVYQYLEVDALPSSTRLNGFSAFEKRCSKCGRLISEAEWKRLLFLGFQVVPPWRDDPGEVLELRNDTCGTTLSRLAPFTPTDLEVGAEHELEHTNDLQMARRIAADHLYEDPRYYEKLEAAGL